MAETSPRSASCGVCVVGMHRSGTSLTMGVLRRLGFDIGPEQTLVPTVVDDNPDGYLEQRAFVQLDNELLAILGGHVGDPPAAPKGWHTEPALAEQRARAAELVRATFDGGPWGWKDPRAALLLPFWQAVVPGLRVVICVRNPAEVAASMMRRDPDVHTWDHWLRMWLRHTADALADSAASPRHVVVYEDLLAAPEREARRLGTFLLGVEPTAEQLRAGAAAVREDVRRQQVSDAMLAGDPRTPAAIGSAYLALRAAVRGGEPLEAVTQLLVRTLAAFPAERPRSRDAAPTGPLRSLAARVRALRRR